MSLHMLLRWPEDGVSWFIRLWSTSIFLRRAYVSAQRSVTIGEVMLSREERFISGDQIVLKELYEEHAPLLLGLSRRLVGPEAEDLVQIVFLQAWKNRQKFDPEKGSLISWLCGITRFRSIDFLRMKGRRPTKSDVDIDLIDIDAEKDADKIVDRLIVTTALKSLNPLKRQVVELAFFEGVPHAEIARKVNLPLGTVKSHIRRGLKSLEKELGGSRVEI